MDSQSANTVRERAQYRCEYCGLHQDQSPLAVLHIEHIRPKNHGGTDDLDNLALACIDCNLHKGSDIAGYDPLTDQLTELFNPRRDRWDDHFEWAGILILGRTPIGRTTVRVLQLNAEDRLQLRGIEEG